MSTETHERMTAAIQEHIADETGGDKVVGFALVAGIIEAQYDSKTSFLSTSPLARYEVRGLLHEGLAVLDAPPQGREG